MKKFSKKSALLFAGAMAVCAFMLPSGASAASWSPIGLETTLHSPDVGFTATLPGIGPVVSRCTRSSFTATVASAQNLEITATTFGGHCTAIFTGLNATCTTTMVGTSLPWTATATTTSNIQIHGVRIDVRFENTPGNVGCGNVGLNGETGLFTGTVTNGRWTGNAIGQRSIVYSEAEGLRWHSQLGSQPLTVRGTFSSTGALQVS